jgi:putative SbcD/Mre11-related phosphoesterase
MHVFSTVVNVRPLHPHPALLLDGIWNGKEHKYIAISDLHIGFESALYMKGVSMDSSLLLGEMLREISDLIKFHQVDGVVLLGDLKNSIGSISKQEWNWIPQFFKSLSDNVDVYLVPGNHDGSIRFLTPHNVNMVSTKGMVLDENTLLIHGHTMPSRIRSSIKRIVMGHIHPIFQKSTSVISGQRVWIYLKVKRENMFLGVEGILDIIVIPTFNKYLFAAPERRSRKPISPLIKKALKSNAVQQAMIVTLDGSIVGDTATTLESVI